MTVFWPQTDNDNRRGLSQFEKTYAYPPPLDGYDGWDVYGYSHTTPDGDAHDFAGLSNADRYVPTWPTFVSGDGSTIDQAIVLEWSPDFTPPMGPFDALWFVVTVPHHFLTGIEITRAGLGLGEGFHVAYLDHALNVRTMPTPFFPPYRWFPGEGMVAVWFYLTPPGLNPYTISIGKDPDLATLAPNRPCRGVPRLRFALVLHASRHYRRPLEVPTLTIGLPLAAEGVEPFALIDLAEIGLQLAAEGVAFIPPPPIPHGVAGLLLGDVVTVPIPPVAEMGLLLADVGSTPPPGPPTATIGLELAAQKDPGDWPPPVTISGLELAAVGSVP